MPGLAEPERPSRDYWPTEDWRTADPAQHAISARALDAARDYVQANVPHIDSLLVVRGGDLVYEWYAASDGITSLHNVKSVTKSVTSALVGIALDTGDLASIDESLGFILPEIFSTVDDRHKRTITIGDLLTMRSGLSWAEYGRSAVQLTASPNWIDYILEHPLEHEPGNHFNYSTGDTQLIAAALQKLTAMPLLDYADMYLFRPLGITRRAWAADPQGINIGGAELQLTARDMAKFGYLYLNHGLWDGEQVIPDTWVNQSHTPQVELDRRGNECEDLAYGLLWWLRSQGGHASGIAVGYGGQFVYVIPALDMVVVMTGDLRTAPETFRDNRMLCQFNLVEDFIVPAAE